MSVDELIQQWDRDTHGFTLICGLELSPSLDLTSETFSLRLILGSAESPADRLVVRFGGVDRLQIDGLTPGGTFEPLLVEDLKDRGWEGSAFRVSDPEEHDQLLSFYCDTITWQAVVHPG